MHFSQAYGDYELAEGNNRLGEGFSSNVYLARHRASGEAVALKVIDRATLKSEIEEMLLRNEIKALHLVSHENVVRLLRVF
jgi:serine/threonine protein kinase